MKATLKRVWEIYLSVGAILASSAFVSTHLALFLVPGRLYEQSGGEIGTAIWGTIVFYVINCIGAILRAFLWPISLFALLSGQIGFWEFLFPALYGMPSVVSPP